jgi:hypothetical protein
MSEASRPELDAILARIERDLAEAPKLRAESEKYIAEQRKLIAEASKLDRDRAIMPWQVVATLLGAGAALFAAGAGFIKLIGS